MNKELKRKLVDSISQAQDLAELKASLLALLGVAVAEDPAENDIVMADSQPENQVSPNVNLRKRRKEAAAKGPSQAAATAPDTPGTSSTPGSQGGVSDADDSFEVVQRKKCKSKHVAGATVEQSAVPRAAKVGPLVLEGVSDEQKTNPLVVRKLLEEHTANIAKKCDHQEWYPLGLCKKRP